MTPQQLYNYFLLLYLSWGMSMFCAKAAAAWSSGFNPCC